MPTTTRKAMLDTLENEWGTYAARFQALSPAEQRAFLQKQGYERLGDLLGHVAAWWQDGIRVVGRLQADPAMPNIEYDMDLFNAQAVERFAPLSESECLHVFETTRAEMRRLLESLPEEVYWEGRIADRLRMEVIGHYDEHPFDAPAA